MKKSILFILISCFLLACSGRLSTNVSNQDINPLPLNSGEEILAIKTDVFDNIYLLKPSGLFKRNKHGKLLAEYSLRSFDDYHKIELNGPYKVLLFSISNQKLLVLDNQLTELEQIDFTNFEYFDVVSIANSIDQNILVLDEARQTLSNINFNGKLIWESNTIPINFEGVDLLSNEKNILLDAQNKIFVWDLYGYLLKVIDMPSKIGNISMGQDYFYYQSEDYNIYKKNTNSLFELEDQKIKALDMQIQDFVILKDSIFYVQDSIIVKAKLD